MSVNINSELKYKVIKEGYNLDNEWLEACIYFVTENDDSNKCISNEKLLQEIIEQFSFSDIKETSLACLVNCFEKNGKLTKDIVLQVNYLISISDSLYEQLDDKSIKNDKNTQNIKTYKFYLTDGYNNIDAINLDILSWIHKDLRNGFKIMIFKDTIIKNNIIFIENSKTKYIGGFSDIAIEKFKIKSILMDLLKKTRTLNDKSDINEEGIKIKISQPYKNIKESEKNICVEDINKVKNDNKLPNISLSDDSLDNFLDCYDDDKIIQKLQNQNDVMNKKESIKTSQNSNQLNFISIPIVYEKKFSYLTEISSDNFNPFVCPCKSIKLLSSHLYMSGVCMFEVEINDGITNSPAYISNSMFFGPPYFASSNLIIRYIKNERKAIDIIKDALNTLKRDLDQRPSLLLMRLCKTSLCRTFEILAIYSSLPDFYTDYIKYVDHYKKETEIA